MGRRPLEPPGHERKPSFSIRQPALAAAPIEWRQFQMPWIQGTYIRISQQANINEALAKSVTDTSPLTGPEIIELVHFWESYPYREGQRLAAILAAQSNPDNLSVRLRVTKELTCSARLVGHWQLSFETDQLVGSPQIADLLVNEVRLRPVVNRERRPDNVRNWWSVSFALDEAHEKVEWMLLPEFAKRGLDSGALVQSGRLCRDLYRNKIKVEWHENQVTIWETNGNWPICARRSKLLDQLSPSDRDAIAHAERDCIRLCSRAALAAVEECASPAKQLNASPPPEPLTTQQQEVWNYVLEHGPVTGKDIANAGVCEQSTLTAHIVPVLKERGLRNKPGAGYYIPQSNGAATALHTG
jgi:hypothetical protein